MGRSPSGRWRRIKRTSPIPAGFGGSDLEAVCALCLPWPTRLKATRFRQPWVAGPASDPDCRRGAATDWRTGVRSRGNDLLERQGFGVAGRFQHSNRLIILVLGRFPHLIARPLERHPLELVVVGWETKGIPRNCDLPTADAEEATEVDDG